MTTQQEVADVKLARTLTKIAAGVVLTVFLAIGGCAYVKPKYTLYKANTEKQSVIKEQEAQSIAAEFRAKSEVTQAEARADALVAEARGIAESQEIIASTLSEEYLRYLYIRALEGNENQIIYVPTEAGLPVLEAGRFDAPPTTVEQP